MFIIQMSYEAHLSGLLKCVLLVAKFINTCIIKTMYWNVLFYGFILQYYVRLYL